MDAGTQRESEALRRAFRIRFNDSPGAQLYAGEVTLRSAGKV